MRRKKAVKRKIHELEGGRDLFLDLMDTLRRSDNEKALQLVNLIHNLKNPAKCPVFLWGENFTGDGNLVPC